MYSEWGKEATAIVPRPQGVMGEEGGAQALEVDTMEVVVEIFQPVCWLEIFVETAGLFFSSDS